MCIEVDWEIIDMRTRQFICCILNIEDSLFVGKVRVESGLCVVWVIVSGGSFDDLNIFKGFQTENRFIVEHIFERHK